MEGPRGCGARDCGERSPARERNALSGAAVARTAAFRRAADAGWRYSVPVLNCVHHVQWVRRVPGGLHQCILCQQVVTRKDVYPRFEDLGPEFRERWEAHERTASEPAAGSGAGGAAKP